MFGDYDDMFDETSRFKKESEAFYKRKKNKEMNENKLFY